MQKSVVEKFRIEEQEIFKIVNEAKVIKTDESNKVYNKCFLIIGIISSFGLIAVPFNVKKKKYEEDISEAIA